MVLLQMLVIELGRSCVPTFSLLFIFLSRYLRSVCHVPGTVLGAGVGWCAAQSRR